jgi:hypothetical protein
VGGEEGTQRGAQGVALRGVEGRDEAHEALVASRHDPADGLAAGVGQREALDAAVGVVLAP